jgi:hypothetical protein
MRTALAICLSTLFLPTIAAAQVAPKLCVAVARDPDTTTRAVAERVHVLASRSPAVRTVGDDTARGALRGEAGTSPMDATLTALVAHRRALAFVDADARPLAAIADALGCAQIAVVSATPRGISLRRFDVLASRYDDATDAASLTDAALAARLGLAAPTAASSTSTAPSNTATTSTAASTTTQSGATTAANPTTTTANTATTTATNTTAANTANTATATTAAATTPARAVASGTTSGRVATPATGGRADPRVTVGPAQPPARSTPVWAWVVAGVAGAGLVGAFIASQTIGPSVPLVRVSGPGSSP